MSMNNSDACVIQFHFGFISRLNAVGYGNFRTKNPEQTVKLMMQYVYPAKFKEEMQKSIDINKPLQKNVKKFIERILTEVARFQLYILNKAHKTPHQKYERSSGPGP